MCSIDWECTKNGKVNSYLNRSKTVISIFEQNPIETLCGAFAFSMSDTASAEWELSLKSSNKNKSYSLFVTPVLQRPICCLETCLIVLLSLCHMYVYVHAYMHVWTLLKAESIHKISIWIKKPPHHDSMPILICCKFAILLLMNVSLLKAPIISHFWDVFNSEVLGICNWLYLKFDLIWMEDDGCVIDNLQCPKVLVCIFLHWSWWTTRPKRCCVDVTQD